MFIPSAICGCLAYWQYERMRWKEQLIQERQRMLSSEPADVFALEEPSQYEKVKVQGVFMEDSSLFVGPRPRNVPGFGIQSGYFVITPLVQPKQNGGVVLVNRGWAPASWRTEHSQKYPTPKPGQKQQPQQLQAVDLLGLIQPDEQGNTFTPVNKPDKDEFHSVQQSALTAALGLPPDTPIVMQVSDDASTMQQRAKSPLEQSRAAMHGDEEVLPDFPIAKNMRDLVTFTTMPGDHLNYALIWTALCVILSLMARTAVTKPLRGPRMVDGMTRERWQADQQRAA